MSDGERECIECTHRSDESDASDKYGSTTHRETTTPTIAPIAIEITENGGSGGVKARKTFANRIVRRNEITTLRRFIAILFR